MVYTKHGIGIDYSAMNGFGGYTRSRFYAVFDEGGFTYTSDDDDE